MKYHDMFIRVLIPRTLSDLVESGGNEMFSRLKTSQLVGNSADLMVHTHILHEPKHTKHTFLFVFSRPIFPLLLSPPFAPSPPSLLILAPRPSHTHLLHQNTCPPLDQMCTGSGVCCSGQCVCLVCCVPRAEGSAALSTGHKDATCSRSLWDVLSSGFRGNSVGSYQRALTGSTLDHGTDICLRSENQHHQHK